MSLMKLDYRISHTRTHARARAMFFATRWNWSHCASRILFIKSPRERERVMERLGHVYSFIFISMIMLGKDCYHRYLYIDN